MASALDEQSLLGSENVVDDQLAPQHGSGSEPTENGQVEPLVPPELHLEDADSLQERNGKRERSLPEVENLPSGKDGLEASDDNLQHAEDLTVDEQAEIAGLREAVDEVVERATKVQKVSESIVDGSADSSLKVSEGVLQDDALKALADPALETAQTNGAAGTAPAVDESLSKDASPLKVSPKNHLMPTDPTPAQMQVG